jgi:hypothetical protein
MTIVFIGVDYELEALSTLMYPTTLPNMPDVEIWDCAYIHDLGLMTPKSDIETVLDAKESWMLTHDASYILMLGYFDYAGGNRRDVSLGEYNDLSGSGTVCGKLNSAITRIRGICHPKNFIPIIPYIDSNENTPNALGYTYTELKDAMRDVFKYRNVPYIDLTKGLGLDGYNMSTYLAHQGWGLSDEGITLAASYIINQMGLL